MTRNLRSIKWLAIPVLFVLVLSACAPGEIERIPLPGQEQGGYQAPGSGTSGDLSANLELPPTQPICPTPTPIVGDTTGAGGESEIGESVAGPASGPEAVSGGESYPAPNADILDQVNLGPGIGRGDQTSVESGVAPEPGTESQLGTLPGESSGSAEAPAPSFGELLGSVIGQVIGTSEPGTSFEPMPSPTPCP